MSFAVFPSNHRSYQDVITGPPYCYR